MAIAMSPTKHMAIDFKNFTSHPMGCENKTPGMHQHAG
jgi:hypothetical protein